MTKYFSENHQRFLNIANMTDQHVRNAFVKMCNRNKDVTTQDALYAQEQGNRAERLQDRVIELQNTIRKLNSRPTVTADAYDVAWKKIETLEKENKKLRNEFSNQFDYSKDIVRDLREENKELKKENQRLSSCYKIGEVLSERDKKDSKMDIDAKNRRIAYLEEKVKNMSESIKEESAENVRLVAQLENDEHNVGHLDEKMKRLAYLEKLLQAKNYVFSEIPNTPENMEMLKLLKKHLNKDMYRLRWRGQYLVDGEDWRKYVDGQPLSKSKCIRVYIDNLSAYGSTEGFNLDEIRTILDGLHKVKEQSEEFIRSFDIDGEDNEDVNDEKLSLKKTEVLEDYFQEMKFHIEECQQKMSEIE